MIFRIAGKELLLATRTIRFAVLVLVCCLLMPVSAAVMSSDYLAESEDYTERVALEERRDTGRDDEISVFRPLPQLAALFRGVSAEAVNGVKLSDSEMNAPLATSMKSPVHSIFPTVDLTFVIGVVLSALAILLSFDAIAGEKADATLRVMMSNPLARSRVVVGKWLGLSAALLAPFLLGLVICVLLFLAITGMNLSADSWSALGLCTLAACVYLILFVLLGIAVSAFCRRPSVAIFAGLGIWGLLVIFIPNVAVAAADVLVPVEPTQAFERNLRLATNQMLNELRNGGIELASRADNSWPRDRIEPARRRMQWTIYALWRQRFMSMEFEYRNEIKRQEDLGRTLSLASPYACLSDACATMAGTGPDAQRKFIFDAFQYGDRYFTWVYRDYQRVPDTEALRTFERFQFAPVELETRQANASLPVLAMVVLGAVALVVAVIGFNRYDLR